MRSNQVRAMRNKGFTLVELLIVIIIIGILAGAMLLVMGSGTDSAEATKIVSDLRSLKSAALLYYGDHPKATEVPAIGELQKYMDKGDIVADNYTTVKGAADSWWVATNDVTNKIPEGVGKKLVARQKEVGLYANPTESDDYAGGEYVYMKMR